MRIDTHKGRIQDSTETPREATQRARIEKLERQVEDLKRRLPPEPVALEGKEGAAPKS